MYHQDEQGAFGGYMNNSNVKISGLNEKLSHYGPEEGIFCFELSQNVSPLWEHKFQSYISTYRPIVFSLYRPEIVDGKFIKVHAELEGPRGVESVLNHLHCIVKFANSSVNKPQLKKNKINSSQSSKEVKSLFNKLFDANCF